jgi:hypothetical protein
MLNSNELVEMLYDYLETEVEINSNSLMTTLRDMERNNLLKYMEVFVCSEDNYLAVDILPDPNNKYIGYTVSIHNNKVENITARDLTL